MTKQQIIKAIKKAVKETSYEFNNKYQDIQIFENLFFEIENELNLNFGIEYRLRDCDAWLQVEYYSQKLKHSIIMDYEYSEPDDIDELADDIIRFSKQVVDFEKRIKFD